MALNDLTDQNIQDTYQKVVQTDGTNLADGTGSALPIKFNGPNVETEFLTTEGLKVSHESIGNADIGTSFMVGPGLYVEGDILATGDIIAHQYIVSSSVTHITTQTLSGSTEFGDSSDDTHQFTGHITASGNISASGIITAEGLVITDDATITDNLTVNGNQYFNGSFIEGDGKEILRYSDNWLRINEDNDFSSGIYCGTGILRTDGEFQVGGSGVSAKITSAGRIFTTSHITASGNISGSNIEASGDIIATGNISCSGFFTTETLLGDLDEATGLVVRGYFSGSGTSATGSFMTSIYSQGTITANTTITAGSSITGTIVKGSTSIQTPLIEFTDGDDAIVIADGGGVTIANLDVSAGTLTLANNQISGDKIEGGTIAATTITALTTAEINASTDIDIGSHNLTAETLTSDQADNGTAPLTVTSTTVVTNLNADKLDGADLDTTATLGTSDTKVPSQAAVKTYADTKHPLIEAGARLNANLVGGGSVGDTEFGRLDGINDNIQTQLDDKDIGDGISFNGTGGFQVEGNFIIPSDNSTPFVIGKESGYFGSFASDNYYYGNNSYGWNHHSFSNKLPNSPVGTWQNQIDGGTAIGNARMHVAQIVPVACKNITLLGETKMETDDNTFEFFIYKTSRQNGRIGVVPSITQIGTASTTIINKNRYYNVDITTTEGVAAGDKILVVVKPGGTSGQVRFNYTLFGYTKG